MNKKPLLLVLLITLLVSSCKTTKPTLSTMNHATVKLLKEYDNSIFSEKTVQAKIKLDYQDPKQSQRVTIRLRMKKDEVIWMSASFLGFPVAKVKITPTKVQYYEKIKKTYFDGDFSLLSSVLGREINFQQLQNIFLGQSLMSLNSQFTSETDGKSLKLTPKNQDELFDIFYWINPSHFKLDKQEINATKEKQILTIDYTAYQNISNTYFPKTIVIDAIQPKQTTHLEMDFRNVEFNTNLKYTFNIPSGYKEIKLK
ncbi:MAG TPA: DUF4292 domain-containing protein [Lutibacter sp.]|nr:DUF4292 domain-containing protein [Lutibacter sp.]